MKEIENNGLRVYYVTVSAILGVGQLCPESYVREK